MRAARIKLRDAAHGHEARPVDAQGELVTISHETNFERDLGAKRARAQLSRIPAHVCAQVAAGLSRKGHTSRTIRIQLCLDGLRTVTRDSPLPEAVPSADDVVHAARLCLTLVDFTSRRRQMETRAGYLVQMTASFSAMDWARRVTPVFEA